MTIPQYYKGVIDASGCLSNAWELIKPNYWMYFGIALLTYVLVACIPCLNVFLMGPVMGGLYFVSLRAMRGEPVEFGMMFKGFEKFVPLMVVGLIQSVPGIIYQLFNITIRVGNVGLDSFTRSRGTRGAEFFEQAADPNIAILGGYLVAIIIVGVVLFIFSILWAISFAFVVPIVVDNDISIGDALKLSIRASWSNVGGWIVLAILCGLLMFVGAIALCIGMFFVLPVVWVSWAFAYRQVFPDLGPSTTFRYEPPSPESYGSFGQGM
ncbi:MAG: hypothetical protein KIT61_11180 [Pyrinomonadaceae bacterium]|nr:hypothetical protein [Blastocatellia bacterium]MCW5957139.1 hypothetical protein [Pyrinomonadaceae bacterium]